MEAGEIIRLYSHHPGVRALRQLIGKDRTKAIHLQGLQPSAAAAVLSSAVGGKGSASAVYLIVLDDEEEAGYFYHDLTQFLGEQRVFFFPSSYKRAIRFCQRDPANEVLRTEVLTAVSGMSAPLMIVTHPEALAEKVVTRSVLSGQTLQVHRGESLGISFVQETLSAFGFHRVDYVYEPGQFAVRGSIVDVYSFSSDLPYRIDFFGDEVDSIRTFEIESQLSRDRKDVVSIVPELRGGVGGSQSFLSFLPPETCIVTRNLDYVCDSVRKAWDEGFGSQAIVEHAAISGNTGDGQSGLPDRAEVLVDPDEFSPAINGLRRITFSPAVHDSLCDSITFRTHPQPVFHKDFDLLFSTFIRYQTDGYGIYILSDSAKQTERLASIFEDKGTGISFRPVEKAIHGGFVDDDLKACFFTDHQIFDRFHKFSLRSQRARTGKVALTLRELQQFEIGDYVVHVDHGVGRFGGLVRIPEGDKMQEVIKIVYNNDDAVFVSIHSLHKVSKYKGKEGEPPRISTLGTGAWERMKDRTKAKIKDIARDLILLYGKRRESKGFRFSPDSFLQHELEASFLYEDTPDQLKATQDVKADMEKPRPMDRLVCGDVGFGKTEVAVRAAFKACADGKQVAVLVPTTVLAYQHYRTFSERLQGFPVRVEYLSRARNARQTREILSSLADGKVDIIVGTHKLVAGSVRFKDLGLLIIDEEQKFGVGTKEKLRQMKANVDTLTLTATPIPRTLQFSLMGARDLSVIQTPPPNRYPIQTQLCTFSAEVIAEAVSFEMSRNGQVFIVNDRISRLAELEMLVHRHVPDARVAVGHGRMAPEELEKVMLDFANYDYDVLISTSIIESGIDIPNANTIIINGADRFGLSDLHQMRGRVGRSNKKAFCYLLAPPLSALSPEARRRLQAVENFSDLGSGIHIAMQDLDIRGAGNMLGAEQSGFIADLGYETYQKILSQAVSELRQEEFATLYEQQLSEGSIQGFSGYVDECQVESDIPMSFSEEYVPTSTERMLLYRELDSLEGEEDVQRFRGRMADRFGTIPPEGEELIRVVTLRRLGRRLACERMVLKGGRLRMYFISNSDSPFYQGETFGRIISFAAANAHICRLEEKAGRRSLLIAEVPSVETAVSILSRI